MNPAPNPRLRIGDTDREQAVAALQGYVASGHLTLDEFSHRSGAAYQARTHAELAALTADLPPAAEPARGRTRPRPNPPAVMSAIRPAAACGPWPWW